MDKCKEQGGILETQHCYTQIISDCCTLIFYPDNPCGTLPSLYSSTVQSLFQLFHTLTVSTSSCTIPSPYFYNSIMFLTSSKLLLHQAVAGNLFVQVSYVLYDYLFLPCLLASDYF